MNLFGRSTAGVIEKPISEALAQIFAILEPSVVAGGRMGENLITGQPLMQGVAETAAFGVAQGPLMVGAHRLTLPTAEQMRHAAGVLREGLTKTADDIRPPFLHEPHFGEPAPKRFFRTF